MRTYELATGDARPVVAESPGRTAHTAPVDAIDLMKALAIALVLWQHTMPASWTNQVMGNLWIRPAVPIFFVLAGFNLAGSLRRRAGAQLSWTQLRVFYARRMDRIAGPFLIVLAIGYVIALARGRFASGVSMLFGAMPVNAPGNYFVTALLGVVLVLPLIVWAYERRPGATVLACVAVNLLFEAVAATAFRDEISNGDLTFAYQACAARYLTLVVGGIWLSQQARLNRRLSRTFVLLAGLSAAYLVLEHVSPEQLRFLKPGFERETNLAAAPWAVLLVALGLRYLPARTSGAAAGRAAVALGRASFHIFLVQMLWTGVVMTAQSPSLAVPSAIASFALGYLYFRAVPTTTSLLRLRPARRRAAPC